ncbi:TetR family transcriptional regulator [Modestobacter sp. I12A-02628]|nr:TetR family transcriptional regulator [Goekera deserti]
MAGTGEGRVRADAARNRERILAVGAAELARDPHATLEDVVRATGLARATVYRHVPSRTALVDAVVDRALAVAADLLARGRPADDDPEVALARLTRAACSVGPEAIVLIGLLVSGSSTVPDLATRPDAVRIDRLVHDLVRRGQAAGVLRDDVPAPWLADQWFALLQSAVVHPPADGRDPADLVYAVFRDGACGPSA